MYNFQCVQHKFPTQWLYLTQNCIISARTHAQYTDKHNHCAPPNRLHPIYTHTLPHTHKEQFLRIVQKRPFIECASHIHLDSSHRRNGSHKRTATSNHTHVHKKSIAYTMRCAHNNLTEKCVQKICRYRHHRGPTKESPSNKELLR